MASIRWARLYLGAPLLACAGLTALPGTVAAAAPTLIWRGAKRVQILCNVAGGPGIDHVALTSQLCRDATRIAASGVPMPVRAIAIGDPAVLAADAVTLLIHASVTTHRQERLLAFSVRPHGSLMARRRSCSAPCRAWRRFPDQARHVRRSMRR